MAKDFNTTFGIEETPIPVHDSENAVREASSITVSTPETEGKLYDMSRRTRRTIAELRGDMHLREQQDKQQRNIDALKANKKVANWLQGDVSRTLVTMDDYENLAKLQQSVSNLKNYSARRLGLGETVWNNTGGVLLWGGLDGIGSLGMATNGLIQMAADGLSYANEAIGADVNTGLWSNVSDWAAENAATSKELVPTLWAMMDQREGENSSGGYRLDTSPEAFERQRQLYYERKNSLVSVGLGIPYTDIAFSLNLDDVMSGAVSLAPSLAAAPFTGGASLWGEAGIFATTAGLQSMGSTYADKRYEGLAPKDAANKAALAFTITAPLTLIFHGGTEQGLTKLAAALRKSSNPKQLVREHLAKVVGKGAVDEFAEEGIDEFLNAMLVDEKGIIEAASNGLKAGYSWCYSRWRFICKWCRH